MNAEVCVDTASTVFPTRGPLGEPLRFNSVAEPDTDISARDAGAHGGVRVLAIASREDLQIAAGVERAQAPGSRS